MTLEDLLREIAPRPRARTVTFGKALPYAIFLLLFGGGTLCLVLAHMLTFTQPGYFLLLAVTPWFWWMHAASGGGMTPARGAVALVIRLFIVGAFIYALAEPRAVRGNNDLSVMFAMDMSDSVGERAADQALKFVTNAVSKKPEKDQAGLVVFGRDAAVELPPRITFPLEAVNSRVGRDATNLEKGLSLTAAMIPDSNPGRIVLISDGTSTEGNLTPVLEQLAAREVPVDVLPIQYAYDKEVWLEKLELPKIVRVGETYEAAVILCSLQPGSGKLTLRENDQIIFSEDAVTYEAGKNRFTLPLYLRAPGFYEYVARIEPAAGTDGWAENNVAINHLYIKGEGKVLLVTDPSGEPKDWQDFAASIKRAERVVEQRPAFDFPRDSLSLLPYDCIVFVNVAADAFDAVQMEALRDSVFNQGTGFLMVGGKNSFGPGGYNRTPVEEALPVTMDVTQKKVLPKGALVIILHTCEFAEGNTWAKRITKEAIRVLSAKDDVGVLAYGNGAGWIFEPTPAGEYEKLAVKINDAQIGDMPDFGSTMQLGLTALKANDAATKHMIIISDGDPSPPPPNLVAEFVANKISVSTIAIFPHGGTEISTLSTIAGSTGGRYYYPQDPNLLPSIFIKEAKTIRRSMIVNELFTPVRDFPSPILKGMDAVPPLRGFVLTTPKERSNVILKSPHEDENDPVLAIWRYGVGKSAAFTSDLSPNWGAAWVEWEKYDPFVKQLLMDISRVEQHSDLQVSSFSDGGNGVMVAEDFKPQSGFLQIEAQVSGPRGRSERVQLKQVAPGRYQAEFPLWGMGRYQVTVLGQGGGRNERATGGFAVPYSPEYLRFSSNGTVLERIAHATGGRLLAGTETAADIFPPDRPWRRSSRPVLEWVLIVLACLIPLDVGVRRVQLDWAVIRGWFLPRRKAEQDQTLGALLQRKQQIKFTAPEAEAGKRAPTHIPQRPRPAQATQRPATPQAQPPAAPAPEKPPAPGPSGTTGRLLEMKKKWKKKDE